MGPADYELALHPWPDDRHFGERADTRHHHRQSRHDGRQVPCSALPGRYGQCDHRGHRQAREQVEAHGRHRRFPSSRLQAGWHAGRRMPPPGLHAQTSCRGLNLRSLLFVPADSEKKIPKALGSAADVVILDLEDSVALADKPKARGLLREILAAPRGRAKLFVRVNALDSGLVTEDVAAVAAAKPDGLLLPKSQSGGDVKRLIAMAGLPVIAIATETAASMFTLGTYGGCGPNLLGLTWGMEDLAAALGAQLNRDAQGRPTSPYELARTLCLIGARAAGVEPIDGV